MTFYRTALLRVLLTCGLLAGCAGGDGSKQESLVMPKEYIKTKTSPVDVHLLNTLTSFADALVRGQDVTNMLEGDRLLILSDSLYNEVMNGESNNYYVPLSYGCSDTCGLSLQEIGVLLARVADSGAHEPNGASTSAVKAWPSLTLKLDNIVWKISFGKEGNTIVAVELFGDLELLHSTNL